MLKVLLAYRCSKEGEANPFERILPVGVGYVHAYLKSRGVPTALANFSTMTSARIRKILLAERPDVVGLSTFTFNRGATIDLARIVRDALPAARVVLGGPHPTHVGGSILEAHPEVDACVIGEGEITLDRFVAALAEGSDPSRVPGLLLRAADGSIRATEPASPIADLDRLPFPALYPEGYGVDPRAQYPYVVTSRGCPAKCTFCSSPEFWGSAVRFRSAENILDELELLRNQFGILYVSFRDDIFTLNKARVIDLCRGMIARKLSLLWDCQTRVNTIDAERLVWMKRAGATVLQYGIESGSQQVLDRLKKGQRLEQIDRAAALTRTAGLVLSIYLIAGVPGETEEDLRLTEAMLDRIRPHDGIVTPLAVFPGTGLWEEMRANEGVGASLWETVGPDGLYVRPGRFTEEAILRLSSRLEAASEDNAYTTEDFRRHRELDGETYVTDLLEGEMLERWGDTGGARKLYEDLSAREPWNPWPLLRLGRLALAARQGAEGERSLRRALQLVPASAEARSLLASSLRVQDRTGEAREIEAGLSSHRRSPAKRPIRPRGFQSWPLPPSFEGRDGPC